ncbi:MULTISPECIES: hypothetical protein [Anoxynatronum]|uniref:Zn-finger containing protein n=2 Tax=Anoxynatronum TaxID=210622 RepID=A0AA46AHE4_9CLOT|nr:hypothetical protein [Anoxynatronum buryatiense]SMP38627.1 hypothetical protein SAMN06296020_101127 [Anoxynatronum buryatiense]
MNWLQRWMVGRAGGDHFSLFLLVSAAVINLIGRWAGLSLLVMVGYTALLVGIYRTFSKNVYQRRLENQKFLKAVGPIIDKVGFLNRRRQDAKTHHYFQCVNCKKTLRVPKGKGKVRVTCPACKNQVVRKI